ncbi:MAG: YlxR family protein [Actinobacteria bacterium]|nr:YlxR family protein [Actinomycetota bacterium]
MTPGPIRTCVGCRSRRPLSELVRFVGDDGVVMHGSGRPGRGAWLCPSETCWEQASKRRIWSRALRRSVVLPAGGWKAIEASRFRGEVRS